LRIYISAVASLSHNIDQGLQSLAIGNGSQWRSVFLMVARRAITPAVIEIGSEAAHLLQCALIGLLSQAQQAAASPMGSKA
jgi:hypothetical protein